MMLSDACHIGKLIKCGMTFTAHAFSGLVTKLLKSPPAPCTVGNISSHCRIHFLYLLLLRFTYLFLAHWKASEGFFLCITLCNMSLKLFSCFIYTIFMQLYLRSLMEK